MKKVVLLLQICSFSTAGFSESGTLTLERALELAGQSSPRLSAAQRLIDAAQQRETTAGRLENPQLEFEAEGVGGDLNGVDRAEYSVMLSQTFARGDKRALEREMAGQTVDVALQAHAEQELNLMGQVRRAFADVFSQQETGAIRREQERLGRAFLDVAHRRHEAGGASELDVVQAELALQEILLEQTCSSGDLKAARIRLASLVGISELDLPEVGGVFYEIEAMDDLALVDSHPVLQKLDAQIEQLFTAAAQARAADTSDITLGAGVRHEAADHIDTFIFGLSMPLNFSRSGRVNEAAGLAEARALALEREEMRRVYQQHLSGLVAEYESAREAAELIAQLLLPKAKEAYELTEFGYGEGRFSWMELIDALQRLAAIRIRNVDALRDAHRARADIVKFMSEEL